MSCHIQKTLLHLSPSLFLQSFHPVFHDIPWALGKGRYDTDVLFMAYHSLVTYFGQLWVSVLIAMHWQKKFLWWNLRDMLIYAYRDMDLEGILYDIKLIKQNNSSMFNPGLHTLQARGSWPNYSTRHVFPLVEWVLVKEGGRANCKELLWIKAQKFSGMDSGGATDHCLLGFVQDRFCFVENSLLYPILLLLCCSLVFPFYGPGRVGGKISGRSFWTK